jgi:hypothetical protein
MNKTNLIIGTIALILTVGLNVRHALNNYGILDNKLHMEVLAQSNGSGGNGSGSNGNGSGSNGNGSDTDGSDSGGCESSSTTTIGCQSIVYCYKSVLPCGAYAIFTAEYSCLAGSRFSPCITGTTVTFNTCDGTGSPTHVWLMGSCK